MTKLIGLLLNADGTVRWHPDAYGAWLRVDGRRYEPVALFPDGRTARAHPDANDGQYLRVFREVSE